MQPKNAALLLLATAIVGQVLIKSRGREDVAPGEVAFRIGDTTSARRHREEGLLRTADLGPGETVDLDRAGAGEIARLPGVGPSLAKRIVADRVRNGPFGGVDCLDARVSGVGEGFVRRVGDKLRFSGAPCAPGTRSGSVGACPEVIDLNRATAAQLDCLPGIGRSRGEAIVRFREGRGGVARLEELEEVPGLSERVISGLRGHVEVGPMP